MKKIPFLENFLINEDGTKIFNCKTKRNLHPSKNNAWYLQVCLSQNGNKKAYLVHRLVYETFIGHILNKDIDHIDGNKENNFYMNLRECSHKENCNFDLSKKHRSNSAKLKKWTDDHRRKIADSHKGRIFVNNGIVIKKVFPNEIPAGFVKGRIKRK